MLDFRRNIVTCILYLILPNSFCFPLNQHSYVHSMEEKRIDENSMAQIKEAKLVNNLYKNTFDDQNNQIVKSNVDYDDFELNDHTKYKDDKSQPKNKRIGSLIKGIRKTTIQQQPETSSNIYIYINGNLDQKRTVWRWSCLYLFVFIIVMVVLLKFFYYNFDLGFYYVNPESTELLSENLAKINIDSSLILKNTINIKTLADDVSGCCWIVNKSTKTMIETDKYI